MHIFFIISIIVLAIIYPFYNHYLMKWGIPKAIEIAKFQGWVSPIRMSNQTRITRSTCQSIIDKAVKEGLLCLAVDGHYHLKTQHEDKAQS